MWVNIECFCVDISFDEDVDEYVDVGVVVDGEAADCDAVLYLLVDCEAVRVMLLLLLLCDSVVDCCLSVVVSVAM